MQKKEYKEAFTYYVIGQGERGVLEIVTYLDPKNGFL